MQKVFLPIMLISSLIAACVESPQPSATASVAPSAVPVPELAKPRLMTELKLETQTGTSYSLDWSLSGETLAVASGGEITLLRGDLQGEQTVMEPAGGALAVAWNPDESQFATVNGFRDPVITLWDWDKTQGQLARARQIRAGADQYGVSWSPDGKLLATLAGDSRSIIQIWETSTWAETNKYELPYSNPRRALRWNRDNKTVYGAGESGAQMIVFALNVTDGSVRELGKFPISRAEVFAISPDAKSLAIADPRGVVEVIDIASGEVLMGMKTVNQPVDLAWNPNGLTLAILDYKTTLQLWVIAR